MIGTTLEFLRKHLDGSLRLLLGGILDDGTAEKVVFPPGNQEPADPIRHPPQGSLQAACRARLAWTPVPLRAVTNRSGSPHHGSEAVQKIGDGLNQQAVGELG